jgi:hypothetical protein
VLTRPVMVELEIASKVKCSLHGDRFKPQRQASPVRRVLPECDSSGEDHGQAGSYRFVRRISTDKRFWEVGRHSWICRRARNFWEYSRHVDFCGRSRMISLIACSTCGVCPPRDPFKTLGSRALRQLCQLNADGRRFCFFHLNFVDRKRSLELNRNKPGFGSLS